MTPTLPNSLRQDAVAQAPGTRSYDAALHVIAYWPCPERDDMQAANMRRVALAALAQPSVEAPAAVEVSRLAAENVAADSYWQIADTMKTLDGYSVQEHVSCMREVMQACSDYLHDIHGSSEGGDDAGVALAADVRNVLNGRIDLVRVTPTDTIGEDHGA